MKDDGMGCFGMVMLALIALVLGPIVHGAVVSILWGWFVEPTFGLPRLSVPMAIGLTMVFRSFQYAENGLEKSEEYSPLLDVVLALTLKPALTLAFAWIVHRYI